MSVLGVGAVLLAIATLAYAVTRSGIRVSFWVPEPVNLFGAVDLSYY
jgi:Na+-transporting methylmalonyl-CoA/oxaloacetate decarboxylase gamma subunit